MSWQNLENGNTDLAEFGANRFGSRVAYLATVRDDGVPRVHPVTPIIAGGNLFVFIDIASPKGRDLERNGKYAMHVSVENEGGGNGEFFITGKANLIDDLSVRTLAEEHAGYDIIDSYRLFQFEIDKAIGTVYNGHDITRQRWTSN